MNRFKRSWFVFCDWWISIRFVCFCVTRFLLVIVIVIEDSENENVRAAF